MIITSLVTSKLLYCSTVWSNTTCTNIKKLQSIQNFACKIITGSKKYDHVSPLLQDLEWLKPGSHDEISIRTSSGTFDLHKRKHKKNATFVLLMLTSKVPLAYAYFIV
jgi:hypothetical protein